MSDSMLLETYLKKGRLVRTTVRAETFGKFLPVVSLDTLDGIGKSLDQVFQKLCGRIRIVFLKSFHKAPARIFVNALISLISSGVC